jgi:hypothetical protein
VKKGVPKDFLAPSGEKLAVEPFGALHAHLGRYGLHEHSCPIRKHADTSSEKRNRPPCLGWPDRTDRGSPETL